MDFGENDELDNMLDTPLESEDEALEGGGGAVSGGKVKVGGLELDLQAMLSADGASRTANVQGKAKNKAASAERTADQQEDIEDGSDQQTSDEDGDEKE